MSYYIQRVTIHAQKGAACRGVSVRIHGSWGWPCNRKRKWQASVLAALQCRKVQDMKGIAIRDSHTTPGPASTPPALPLLFRARGGIVADSVAASQARTHAHTPSEQPFVDQQTTPALHSKSIALEHAASRIGGDAIHPAARMKPLFTVPDDGCPGSTPKGAPWAHCSFEWTLHRFREEVLDPLNKLKPDTLPFV